MSHLLCLLPPLEKPLPIREVRAGNIGHLITVKGIVIRVTEVQPYLTLCTYTCPKCSVEIFQRVSSNTFTPLNHCISDTCQKNKPPGKLEMQTRGCKFSKYQEVSAFSIPR